MLKKVTSGIFTSTSAEPEDKLQITTWLGYGRRCDILNIPASKTKSEFKIKLNFPLISKAEKYFKVSNSKVTTDILGLLLLWCEHTQEGPSHAKGSGHLVSHFLAV